MTKFSQHSGMSRTQIFNKRPQRAAIGRWLLVLMTAALPAPGIAQSVHPITGRRIAPVMGAGGADWLDREEREGEEQPQKAIAQLHLKPGMYVADVGAGTGYYSIRIAQSIVPGGLVYANDIQQEMLDRLAKNAAAQHVTNIVPVLGTESDPRLPAGKIDLIILVDVYHEFSMPERMLDRLRNSLKPNGELVLLEYRQEDPSIPIRPEHKMTVAEIKAEVIPQGYRFEKLVEVLPRQHMVFFLKPQS